MLDSYAKTLAAVAAHGDEKQSLDAVGKLIAHLKSRGQLKMLPEILRELRVIEARRKTLAPKVEVATQGGAAAALSAAEKEGIHAKKAIVNDSLISGWRARAGGRLVDRTGKRALVQIYTNVVGGK